MKEIFLVLPLEANGSKLMDILNKSVLPKTTLLGVLMLKTIFGSMPSIQLETINQSHLHKLHCSGSTFHTLKIKWLTSMSVVTVSFGDVLLTAVQSLSEKASLQMRSQELLGKMLQMANNVLTLLFVLQDTSGQFLLLSNLCLDQVLWPPLWTRTSTELVGRVKPQLL